MFFLAALIPASIFIMVLQSPAYLYYTDPPTRTDAVVLYIGPDVESRQNEAVKLVHAGYADYVIVPAYDHVYKKVDQQSLLSAVHLPGTMYLKLRDSHPNYYEQTHVEVLKAKKIMDHFGFRKANFVSSPYHMRRLKVITERIFPVADEERAGYQIRFVSAPLQSTSAILPSWNLLFIETMLSEYAKIIWFRLYGFLS